MKTVYLACSGTLSSSPTRRNDAFEHDKEFGALKAAFDSAGDTLIEADWRQPLPDADLYFIRTVWDYPDHPEEFLRFLDRDDLKGRLVNHPDIIKDTMTKLYLKRLIDAELPVIPSFFPTAPLSFREIAEQTGWQDVVVKPLIGGSGLAQKRLGPTDKDKDSIITADQFVQPFLPQIFNRGEVSLIYFNGRFSHGLLKTNPTGDYRIQSLFGGIEHPFTPQEDLIATGADFLTHLPALPLAARVDFIPVDDGYQLIELEAIEPYLYPDFCADFGAALKQAIDDRL